MPNIPQKILQAKRKQKQQAKEKYALDKDSNDVEITDDSPKDHTEVSIKMATKLWDNIKRRVKEDSAFAELSDNKKIEIYQKSEFKDFYTEFPIVCRYMICMGQYSNKAFKKFLLKCKNVKHDTIKSREKNYSENQWVMRQADYVRYLWESYQHQHYSPSESKNIWQHAYQTLSKEFADFKELHEDIENKLKDDEKINRGELAKELLKRLANQEQSLDDNTTINLLENLKKQVTDQRKKILIKSIENDVKTIPPSRTTKGSRKELKPSKS